VAKVRNCFYTVTDESLECVWSQALAALPGATIPVRGLGSSDCRSGCGAHLVQLPVDYDLARLAGYFSAFASQTVNFLR
jgi:Uri superfamily endonuclease